MTSLRCMIRNEYWPPVDSVTVLSLRLAAVPVGGRLGNPNAKIAARLSG